MDTKNKKLKPWAKLLIIIASVIAFIGVILLGAIGYFRLSVNEYYKNSEKAFVIPGLSDGYVPQGFCYDQKSDCFLATGYMTDNSASPVFVIDKESGKTVKSVRLKKQDGSSYTGHAGGIAVWGDFVYVADGGEHCVYVFNYSDLMENGTKNIESIGTFETETDDGDYIKPAFVEVNGNNIVIGEFYRDPQYKTHTSHKITTPNGNKNTALAVEFELDASFTDTFGINPTPKKAYSMREQVQGLTFDESGRIYLSTSWGLSFSHIFVYDQAQATCENKTVLEHTIPVYHLDGASLIKDIKIAPMSEEMVILGKKLYVMCESASNKYIFGKFTGGKWCYATDLTKYGL